MLKRKQNENKENSSPKKSRRSKIAEDKTILGQSSNINIPESTETASKCPLEEKSNIEDHLPTQKPSNNDEPSISLEETPINEQAAIEPIEEIEYEATNEFVSDVKAFKNLLRNTISSGDFSVSGEAKELPTQLGLFIKNVGIISTPLTEHQASDIIKVSAQAPFGLNYETIVDKRVRDSFQINPDQIEIQNPEWNQQLNALVQHIATQLGCVHKNVEAKLYKLLLYQKGGHFSKHRDTEKEKNMFGTLVIQLPSIYEGGTFNVYHKDVKKSYDFGRSTKKVAYSMHFTAHYADLEHELLEITSGYRLALVYSLCSSDSQNCFVRNDQASDQMSKIIKNMSNMTKPIAILLDHKYTTESLSKMGAKALKGLDSDRYNLLHEASLKQASDDQLCLYITNVKLILDEWNSRDDYYKNSDLEKRIKKLMKQKEELTTNEADTLKNQDGEEIQQSQVITDWYGPNGESFLEKRSVFSDFVVPVEFFSRLIDPNTDLENDKVDKWSFSDVGVEYTGNEGSTIITKYNRYMLTFWPKKKEFQMIATISNKKALDILYDSLNKIATKRPIFRANMKQFLNKMNDSFSGRSFTNLCYDKIVEMLLAIDDINLTKLFILKLKGVSGTNLIEICYKLWSQHNFEIEMFKSSLEYFVENKMNSSYVLTTGEIGTKLLVMIQALKDMNINYKYICGVLFKFGEKVSLFKETMAFYESLGQESFDYLFKLFEIVTNSNLKSYCTLTQNLLSFKYPNWALKSLQQNVLPILDQPDEFSKLKSRYWGNESSKLYHLAETILLFDNQEDQMAKFKDLILKSLDESELYSLLEEIVRENRPNFSKFNNSKPILDLFIHHLKYLDEKIKSHVFSWSMEKASIPKHKEVEDFLKSSNIEMVYQGAGETGGYFASKSAAECFASTYRYGSDYCVQITAFKKPNQKAFVKIVKSKSHFESISQDYKRENDLLKKFVLTFVRTQCSK